MTRALVLLAEIALFIALANELGSGLMHHHQRQPFPTCNCSHLHYHVEHMRCDQLSVAGDAFQSYGQEPKN